MPDLSSVAREAAEREYPLPDDLSTTSHSLRLVAREHFANGFTECASRLPSEEELAAAVARALDGFPDSETFDAGRSYADQEAECVTNAVLALIGEKISG